jgi:hypothetical protein
MASFWTRVDRVANHMQSVEPPLSALEHVSKAFAVRTESQRSNQKAIIPLLSFDSMWRPAWTNVRSGFAQSRHVMYAVADINIHMHLQPEPKSDRIDLAGQVSLRSAEYGTFPPFAVEVRGKSGIVAATTTNDFGEFHVCFVPERGLKISFVISDKLVVIPLEGRGTSKQ